MEKYDNDLPVISEHELLSETDKSNNSTTDAISMLQDDNGINPSVHNEVTPTINEWRQETNSDLINQLIDIVVGTTSQDFSLSVQLKGPSSTDITQKEISSVARQAWVDLVESEEPDKKAKNIKKVTKNKKDWSFAQWALFYEGFIQVVLIERPSHWTFFIGMPKESGMCIFK